MEKSLAERLKNAVSYKEEPEENEIKYELYFLSQANNHKGSIDLTNAFANFYYKNFKGYGTLGQATKNAIQDLGRISNEADDLFGTRSYGEKTGKIQNFFNEALKNEK